MAIDANYDTQYLHRKWGKLFYNISDAIALDEDLIIDDTGAPDEAQNPDAVFIGATDAGYEFSAEPTIVEEEIDESETPIEVAIETIVASITFDSLEVTDLERQSALIPFATYDPPGTPGDERIRVGGGRLILPTKPVCVISQEKNGGWMYVILWAGYNSGPHQLQFKRKERSKQNMVIKGLSVATREEGDRLYRVGKAVGSTAVATLTITDVSPLTPGGTNGSPFTHTFAATGGTAPYTWSKDSGTFPPGVTLSSAGVLSGTPSAAGTYNYVLKAVDSLQAFGTKAFTQVVA